MDSHDDIERLFREVEKRFGESNEGIKQMFAILIHETLTYRDELVNKKESALNVSETQRALNALMEILKSHKFPEIDDPRIKELVMRWLSAINMNIHR